MSHLVLHTDGGSRGNPGPAAIGIVIEVEKGGKTELIGEISETIGLASNNVAEYRAIIRGLEEAQRLGASGVTCVLDSLLVVEQLNGNYRVKSEDMKPLYSRVDELRQHFTLVTFAHVRREQNQEADRLVNAALDGRPVDRLADVQPVEVDSEAERIVRPAPRPKWAPLPRPGVRGVEGKVLVQTGDLTLKMLRFATNATIDQHRAEHETYVACVEGEGWIRVGSIEASLCAGEWSRWPAGADHRIWTTDNSMVMMTVELAPARRAR